MNCIKNHIFLIGSMKSGTTTLFDLLSGHPEICPSIIKEPEYFSLKMGVPEYKKYEYLDLFELRTEHKYTLEGSTGYTKFPNEKGVPERIFKQSLKPKFIYIVRNPFDRIESHYNFMRNDLTWKSKITSDHLINVSNYYLQLIQYQKFFNNEDFLVLDFDELISDHNTILSKVYDFLGIEDKVFFNKTIVSNITKPKNIKELKFKKSIYSKPLKWIPRPVISLLKKFVFKPKKMKLTTKQKKLIKMKLDNDIRAFGKEYNFDIKKWGFN